MKKYKFDVFNILEKIMVVFFILVCLIFLTFFIRNIHKKTETKRHKVTLLESIDRLNLIEQYSDTVNGVYYFSIYNKNTDDRNTTINFDLKNSFYHCVFWDYRGEYYENSSMIEKFFWDDFIINGSFHSENSIDSIIIMKLKLKIIKEYQ